MNRTKTQFKWFGITQYEEEGIYLRGMHKNGWRLTKVTFPGIYHFEECVPEDVVYQLDYNREGAEHRSEYVQMFADCGWEYLFDFVGYSYFRKPVAEMTGEENIFCDDESRQAMLERVYKGRLMPLVVIFFSVILPQLVMQLTAFGRNHDRVHGVLFWGFCVEMIIYLVIFAHCAVKYYQIRKK